MSERNIVEPEFREVLNLYRDANSSDCFDSTADNKVFHNVDFYTEFPMPETKLEPQTENILVSEENLNDDPSKDSQLLQTHDHVTGADEFSSEYTELPTNHRSSSVDSTNLNPLDSTMHLNSSVDVRLKSECPPVYPPTLSRLHAAEVCNTVMLVLSGFEDNQGQSSKSQLNFQPFILKNSVKTTDNSTQLDSVAPSMYSPICASPVCEIQTDSLQLRSPIVHASDTVYENKVIMDKDKSIMTVTSEPSVSVENSVLQSTCPSDIKTVILLNPIERTDITTQLASVAPSMDFLVCGSLVYEIPTGSLLLKSPTVHASDSVYENKVIMEKDKPIMSVTSEPSVSEDGMIQSSTGPSLFKTVLLQNTLGKTANLPKKTFNEQCNLNIHAETRDYQRNTLFMNTNALYVNLPLACTANLTQKNIANTVKNHSSMRNVPALSDYQGYSFLMSNEQLPTQYYVPSSAAGPSKRNNESFVDRDISNISTAEGPSGHENYSGFVSNNSESRVTSVRAANGQSNYICNICEYETNRNSDMVRHMRVHTGERPFRCSDCHKTFSTNSYLVEHMRIHTGEKPFNCDDCEFSCLRKSSMKRHKQGMHTCE